MAGSFAAGARGRWTEDSRQDIRSAFALESASGAASGPPLRALIALVLGVLATSWSAIFVRWAVVPGGASAFYRVFIAELGLLVFFLVQARRIAFERRSFWLSVISGIFLGADLALYNSAILRSPATNVTVLCNNTPVFVGVLSWVFLRRSPRRTYWAGLVLSSIGSILLIGLDLVRHTTLGVADLMSLGASLCFAVYLTLTEEVRNYLDPDTVLVFSLAGSSAFLYTLDLTMGVSLQVPDTRSWLALLGLSLGTQLFGYIALTYALGHLPATVTSVALLAQLPLTAALALFLLHEPLSGSQVAGGGLVLAGVWTASRRK